MFKLNPLPFIRSYLSTLQKALKSENSDFSLSRSQVIWLGFCLMGILITNSVAWAKFERASLGAYTKKAISKMFRHSKIPWEKLLIVSLKVILKKYNIVKGILIIDDKDHMRSKNAKFIHALHKIKDKKTGGYFLGQNIVFLYLATKIFCIPVSFAFYSPDPNWKQWKIKDTELKKKGIKKKDRPQEPKRDPNYPKKYEIAIKLLEDFYNNFTNFKVTLVLADALYGNKNFINKVVNIWPKVQVITQIRKNQNIKFHNKKISCERYFSSYKGWNQEIMIRGEKNKKVTAGGARLFVASHKEKRFIIALKYPGETNYRYLIASNLSWNMKEIMQGYTLRWYIEVFFEDWSENCGFCSMAKQCGIEGSERPLILSLLFDHCFFFNTHQKTFIENKLPLATLGSLVRKSRFDSFFQVLKETIESDNPKEKLKEIVELSEELYILKSSKKHLNGLEGTMESRRSA